MANVILIHGRNANAASWNGIDEKLREGGHIVASPTLSRVTVNPCSMIEKITTISIKARGW